MEWRYAYGIRRTMRLSHDSDASNISDDDDTQAERRRIRRCFHCLSHRMPTSRCARYDLDSDRMVSRAASFNCGVNEGTWGVEGICQSTEERTRQSAQDRGKRRQAASAEVALARVA